LSTTPSQGNSLPVFILNALTTYIILFFKYQLIVTDVYSTCVFQAAACPRTYQEAVVGGHVRDRCSPKS
jgi:hypothetical protein